MELNQLLYRLGRKIQEYIRPDQPGDIPPSMVSAIELAKDNVFAGFLAYRHYDDKKGIIHLDDGKAPAIGLVFTYTSSGNLKYPQLEGDLVALLEVLPVGSTMQAASYISTHPDIAETIAAEQDLVDYINHSRINAFQNAVEKQRTISEKQGYLVSTTHYLSFRVPFEGDIKDSAEIQEFMDAVASYKDAVVDSLSKYGVSARTLTAFEFKMLVRTLLNYATPAEILEQKTKNNNTFHSELVLNDTEYVCNIEGGLQVSYKESETKTHTAYIAALTCDAFSKDITLQSRSGVHLSKDSTAPAIPADYWVYSTYLKLADDALNESITQHLNVQSSNKGKNKIDISKSIWHQRSLKHMLGDSEVDTPSIVAKAYTGVTLFAKNPEILNEAKQTMLTYYNSLGFRTAEEVYISLLAHICAMPLQLTLEYEHAQTGFRRANIMPQDRALSLMHIPDVWYGADPHNKGTVHLTRQGMVGRFGFYDQGLLHTTILGKTEYERNAYVKEIVVNALTTETPLYIIEGAEHFNMMCRSQGWAYTKATMSTLPNPYGGITSEDWLANAKGHLQSLTLDLAFPGGVSEHQRIELGEIAGIAISAAWTKHKQNMTLKHISEELFQIAKNTSASNKDHVIGLIKGLGMLLDLPDAQFLTKPMNSALSLPTQGCSVVSLRQTGSTPLKLVLSYLAYHHSIMTSAARLRSPLGIVHNGLHLVYKNLKGHGIQNIHQMTHLKWIVSIDSLVLAQDMEFLKEVLFHSKVLVLSGLDLRSEAVQGQQTLATLTPEELKMLNSIKNSKDNIEAFIKHDDKSNIFLLTLDLHSRLIYTYSPVELAMLDQALDKTNDLYIAIDDIVKGSE